MKIEDQAKEVKPRSALRRMAPFVLLLLGALLFFLFGGQKHFTLDALAVHRDWLKNTVAENHFMMVLATFTAYALATALSLPIGTLLTLAAGLVFGLLEASFIVVAGATAGSILVFLAARSALRDTFARQAGPWLGKMERGFRENALSYLLVLRLLPIFPFWLVNLVPALLGVPFRVYFIGTALGIIPGTVVYAAAGAGLGEVIDKGMDVEFDILLKPSVLLPLLGLCILALLPVFYRRWKNRQVKS